MSSRTILGLVGLTGLIAAVLGAIAVAQVVNREPINLPSGLETALSLGVLAVFGGNLSQTHASVVGAMAQLAQTTIPVGNVSPLGTTTTFPAVTSTLSAPTGSGSGAAPGTSTNPPGSSA